MKKILEAMLAGMFGLAGILVLVWLGIIMFAFVFSFGGNW